MTEATSMVEGEPSPAALTKPHESDRPKGQKPRRRKIGFVIVGVLIALLCLGTPLFFEHGEKQDLSSPVVAVVKAARADLTENVVLTAEFLPYQEIDLHAKVSGFVKSITVDIGDRVKEGQTIAELEVPELRDELKKASASVEVSMEDVKRAEADYSDAHLQYQRLAAVAKERPKLVAQQEIDNLESRDRAMAGALGSAKRKVEESQAEQSRLKTLLAYSLIIVPFDGVITKRYANTGALIEAGTSSNTALPLVRLAQENLLRLRFPVPESAAGLVQIGQTVEYKVDSLSKTYTGKITRFADKVDRDTRTMVTEVDVPNAGDQFKPGMYAYVTLTLHKKNGALAIPVPALSAGAKPTVTIVTHDGAIETIPVTIGLETPNLVEIKEGLKEGDLVVVGSHSGIRPGLKVAVKLSDVPKAD